LEAARCFLPVGETGVCKRKGASRGTRLHGVRSAAEAEEAGAEAPCSAPRGWPLSPAKQVRPRLRQTWPCARNRHPKGRDAPSAARWAQRVESGPAALRGRVRIALLLGFPDD